MSPLINPIQYAAAEAGRDAQRDVCARHSSRGRKSRPKRDVRADREIEVAADDDERGSHRHDAENRGLEQNFGEVRGLKK